MIKKITRMALSAAMAAVVVSMVLVLAKSYAWWTDASVSVLASLIDSTVDVFISLTNFWVIKYAMRPADAEHRYGHGKAEGIAALGQAAFIAGSCVFVVLEALRKFSHPEVIVDVTSSVQVLIFATVVTIALTFYQRYVSIKTNSLAVEADMAHYVSDTVINGAVIFSLLASAHFGLSWIDPMVALLVAAWLLYLARGIGMRAINMLLDREVDDRIRKNIKKIARKTEGVLDIHDLRTRMSGALLMVSMDIEVKADLSLRTAHDISKAVEIKIQENYQHSEVMIHIDPQGDISDSRHREIKDFHVE